MGETSGSLKPFIMKFLASGNYWHQYAVTGHLERLVATGDTHIVQATHPIPRPLVLALRPLGTNLPHQPAPRLALAHPQSLHPRNLCALIRPSRPLTALNFALWTPIVTPWAGLWPPAIRAEVDTPPVLALLTGQETIALELLPLALEAGDGRARALAFS